MLKIFVKQAESVFKKEDKGKSVILHFTFFANYGKDRKKAYELYFSGKRTSSLEKVIEMECLLEIVMKQEKAQICHI